MQRESTNAHGLSVRTALVADCAFEFIAGGLLLVFAAILGDWLAVGSVACVITGVVFVLAGFAIAGLLRAPDPGLVRWLAYANIAGGAVLWFLFFAAWPSLQPAGRAVLGMAGDAFILIGVLELLALRAQAHVTAD